jgi:23S rRNA U2552 (ribose-2'-O)-methylase RlmE/FtsJ
MKKFIGSKRDMVASDSTLERNLSSNMISDELKQINLSAYSVIYNDHFLEPFLKLRCAILDGTYIGGFMKEILFIHGKTDYIFNFNSIPKMGKELVSAERLLIDTNKIVGQGYFNLILGDGLYYTKNMFKLCRETLKSHLLVKTSERLNVIKDVEGIISGFPKQVESISGYDIDRSVRYNVKAVKDVRADTVDYPLQVAIVKEINLKNEKEIFYVITSDMSLSAEQLRYAAHLRWRIENNGFKELNNLYQTKHKYSKDERCFTNLLWIIVFAYNAFHLFLNHIDLSKFILKGKSVFVDWIDFLFESMIEEYSYNTS